MPEARPDLGCREASFDLIPKFMGRVVTLATKGHQIGERFVPQISITEMVDIQPPVGITSRAPEVAGREEQEPSFSPVVGLEVERPVPLLTGGAGRRCADGSHGCCLWKLQSSANPSLLPVVRKLEE